MPSAFRYSGAADPAPLRYEIHRVYFSVPAGALVKTAASQAWSGPSAGRPPLLYKAA